MRFQDFDPASWLWLHRGVRESLLLGLYVACERPELFLGMKVESGATPDHHGWGDWMQFFSQLTDLPGRPDRYGAGSREVTSNALTNFGAVVLELQVWGNVLPQSEEIRLISEAIGRITETSDPPPTPLHAFGRTVHTAFQLGLVARDADPIYARKLWDAQADENVKSGYGQRLLLDRAIGWPDEAT